MNVVYVVNTVETCADGDCFFLEDVFSNYCEAIKHKLLLELQYNTEAHPQKNNQRFHVTYHQLMIQLIQNPEFDEYAFEKLYADFESTASAFTRNPSDARICDLPMYKCTVSQREVDKKMKRIEFNFN